MLVLRTTSIPLCRRVTPAQANGIKYQSGDAGYVKQLLFDAGGTCIGALAANGQTHLADIVISLHRCKHRNTRGREGRGNRSIALCRSHPTDRGRGREIQNLPNYCKQF